MKPTSQHSLFMPADMPREGGLTLILSSTRSGKSVLAMDLVCWLEQSRRREASGTHAPNRGTDPSSSRANTP